MPVPSPLRPTLLDAAAAVGLGGVVAMALRGVATSPAWFTAILLCVVAASIGLWVVWRLVPRLERAAAVLLALFAFGGMFLSSGSLGFGGAWVACLVLARSFGGAAALGYAGLLCVGVAGLHVAIGSDGDEILGEVVGTAVLAGFGAVIALVLQDRERVGAEREVILGRLERANEELQRRLGTEQDLVLAEERARAASELHDGLGHRLAAIGLAIEYAERMAQRDPERARAELRQARATVSEALDAMRRLVRAMHPVELGTARGTDAFLAIAETFRSTGLDIDVSIDGRRELSREHSLLLLRFVQEGLTNVVRHADARHVQLRLHAAADGGIEASIEDSGTGPAARAEDGFGLRSLRGRAIALGGSLEAGPAARGFLLRITLPPADERELAA